MYLIKTFGLLIASLLILSVNTVLASESLSSVPTSVRDACKEKIRERFHAMGEKLYTSSMDLLDVNDAFIVGADIELKGPVQCTYLQIVSSAENQKIATETFNYGDFENSWHEAFKKVSQTHFSPYFMKLPLRSLYQTDSVWRKRIGAFDDKNEKGRQISDSIKLNTSFTKNGYQITPILDIQFIFKIAIREDKTNTISEIAVDFSDGRKTNGEINVKRVGPGFGQPVISESVDMKAGKSKEPINELAHGDYRVTYHDAFCGCEGVVEEDEALDFWKKKSPKLKYTVHSIPAKVVGIVKDPDSKEPVKDKDVTLVPLCVEADMKTISPVKTNSSGAFVFPVVPKGVYTLQVDGTDIQTIQNCDFKSKTLDLGTLFFRNIVTYDITLELDCLNDPTCAIEATAEWKGVRFKYTYGIHPDEKEKALESPLSTRSVDFLEEQTKAEEIPIIESRLWNLIVISDTVPADNVQMLRHAYGFHCCANHTRGNDAFSATATRNDPIFFPPELALPPYNKIEPHTLFLTWGIDFDCHAPDDEVNIQVFPGASEFPTGLDEFSESPLVVDAKVTPQIIDYIRKGKETFSVTYSWQKGEANKKYKLYFKKVKE